MSGYGSGIFLIDLNSGKVAIDKKDLITLSDSLKNTLKEALKFAPDELLILTNYKGKVVGETWQRVKDSKGVPVHAERYKLWGQGDSTSDDDIDGLGFKRPPRERDEQGRFAAVQPSKKDDNALLSDLFKKNKPSSKCPEVPAYIMREVITTTMRPLNLPMRELTPPNKGKGKGKRGKGVKSRMNRIKTLLDEEYDRHGSGEDSDDDSGEHEHRRHRHHHHREYYPDSSESEHSGEENGDDTDSHSEYSTGSEEDYGKSIPAIPVNPPLTPPKTPPRYRKKSKKQLKRLSKLRSLSRRVQFKTMSKKLPDSDWDPYGGGYKLGRHRKSRNDNYVGPPIHPPGPGHCTNCGGGGRDGNYKCKCKKRPYIPDNPPPTVLMLADPDLPMPPPPPPQVLMMNAGGGYSYKTPGLCSVCSNGTPPGVCKRCKRSMIVPPAMATTFMAEKDGGPEFVSARMFQEQPKTLFMANGGVRGGAFPPWP